jgi:signal transduction histidine kinase
MTREGALVQLTADSAHERLKAARLLARNGEPSDIQNLRKALQVETVSYVRTSLNLAIKRLTASGSQAKNENFVEEYLIPPDLRRQIKNEVTEELARQLLHEISSPVGLIAISAEREIDDFEHSKTKNHIDNLRRVFDAIEQLKIASAVPKPTEFDLALLLSSIVEAEAGQRLVDVVSLYGVKPFLINSDPALVSLAASNGIRNAVDAIVSLEGTQPHQIIVSWGDTDIDYWVVVLDRGIGIVGPVEAAFEIGKTTKPGHSGFGLAIARQSIETLGGSCSLQPAAEGGTYFEIRWER